MTGTLPECLFTNLKNLTTLHLSGNGLIGSLSFQWNLSQALSDLSLSYNRLTGSIPLQFQDKNNWLRLDLSYNKLTGTLNNNFTTIPSDGEIYLEVNRLSGQIPSQLLNTQSINILEGNIFTCSSSSSSSTSELPSNDPHYSTYSCGSNTTNDIIYTWIAVVTTLALFILIIRDVNTRYYRINDSVKGEVEEGQENNIFRSLIRFYTWRKFFLSYCDKTHVNDHDMTGNHNNQGLKLFRTFLAYIRLFAFVLSAVSVVIFLPVYGSLTYYFKTYNTTYAWTISGILLSGETPAIILLVMLLFLLLFFVTLYYLCAYLLKTPESNNNKQTKNAQPLNQSTPADKGIIKGKILTVLVYFILFFIDIMIFGVADFLYVIIVHNNNSTVITIAGACLAVFRLVVNHYILLHGIPVLSRWIKQENKPQEGRSSSEGRYEFTVSDVKFLNYLMLLNHIIISIIAILIVLPDCFQNVLFATSSVTSSYVYQECL
jgi:magnesium-transporting ATPase (P-type)